MVLHAGFGLFDFVDLFRADLSGANLRGTEFLSGNLSGADLLGAVIDDATDFRMANLSGAVIDPEDLKWAKMFWVRLDETGDGGVLSS